MMNLYDFVDECRANGLTAQEAEEQYDEYCRECAERYNDFLDDYYSRPDVCAGWAQQDLIDSYRRER